MIDVWLLFSLNFLVSVMTFHTFLASVVLGISNNNKTFKINRVGSAMTDVFDDEEDEEERAERINWRGKITFAVILAVFNLGFWGFAVVNV